MQNHNPAYETFISLDNLKRAWWRVRYCDRPDSRDWIGLKVFAANLDHNLELLGQALVTRTFEPSYPEIKFLPKSSQTLRPMALLAVSDRVVFQAIANVVAEKARSMLSTVTNRQSFANVLSEPGQKRMFVHWKYQYKRFQRKFRDLVEEGNVWLAETDVAAFYETIDHAILLSCLIKGNLLDDKTAEYLKDYLQVWASVKPGERISRGLPQGCIASDLLTNVFLYEFDKDLAVQEYHYIRYVDDIRLLANTKEAVQQGLIRVDRSLKSIELLIQTSKTTVRRVSNIAVAEEVDRMAVKLSQIEREFNEENDWSEQMRPDPLSEPFLHDVAILGEGIETADDYLQVSRAQAQDELLKLFWQSRESIDSTRSDLQRISA